MLHIHRAERADGLIDALPALLSEPGSDPFAPEVVAGPTRGMERWLTQRMSGSLGPAHCAAPGSPASSRRRANSQAPSGAPPRIIVISSSASPRETE